MSTNFSAAPQGLGYLYQARMGLLRLLQESDESKLIIEGLDDLQMSHPQGMTLNQLKHHVSKSAALTNSCSDLWKTIRVWATSLRDEKFNLANTSLFLMSTGQAPSDSAAALLRIGDNRDTKAALSILRDVAATSKNQELTKAFEAFLNLEDAEQELLVGCMVVMDCSPNISDCRGQIIRRIRLAVTRQFVEPLYERLEGWWFNRVIHHLMTKGNQVSAFEVNEKIASLAEDFHSESLPIDYSDESPDEPFLKTAGSKLFVRQLMELRVSSGRVQKAIIDYYRAYTQRSRWVRDQLLIGDEIERFERKLVDEWERYCLALKDDGWINESATEEELRQFGKKVLSWAESECDVRLRPKITEDYVRRGSFHMLANREPQPAIHWHPDFLNLISHLEPAEQLSGETQ